MYHSFNKSYSNRPCHFLSPALATLGHPAVDEIAHPVMKEHWPSAQAAFGLGRCLRVRMQNGEWFLGLISSFL